MTGIPDLTHVPLARMLRRDLDPQLASRLDEALDQVRADVLAHDDVGQRCCGPDTCGW